MDRPFLTARDSRAEVKGSRDALGVQVVWSRLGRHVVGNLTTVSTSVVDFVITLLGYHWAAEAAERDGAGGELATFLKWEQLAGYARSRINNENAFRGTERVNARLNTSLKVRLGISNDCQILGDQKVYGLWGLYSMASRASGILVGEPARLTPAARQLVEEHYLPEARRAGLGDGSALLAVLAAKRELQLDGKDAGLLKGVAKLIAPKLPARVSQFFRRHLVEDAATKATAGKQAQLAFLLDETSAAYNWPQSWAEVHAMAREAGRREGFEDLAERLRGIEVAERVLAPAALLFAHLQGCDGEKIATVAQRVRKQWGKSLEWIEAESLRDLELDFGGGELEAGRRWMAIGGGLATGDYENVIRELVRQNGAVMQARGSAPWAEEVDNALKITVLDERGRLPARGEMRELWRHSYFINSLAAVAFQLRVPRR